MDSRLAVTSRRPDVEADDDVKVPDSSYHHLKGHVSEKQVSKRKLELPLTEACPSVTEWISLNKSR
jgi:hypothetical protein